VDQHPAAVPSGVVDETVRTIEPAYDVRVVPLFDRQLLVSADTAVGRVLLPLSTYPQRVATGAVEDVAKVQGAQ